MRAALGWPDGPIVASHYRSGASLAFAAAQDQLFTATEVNEWAWQGVAPASAALPLPNAPGHPAAWDSESAQHTLHKVSEAEACPAAMALIASALARHLPAFHDEDELSLGSGSGSQLWSLSALPTQVDWSPLHDIPTALVTGSNGKTSTVRLIAAMCAAAEIRAGFNCTDGICIGGEMIAQGDYSGPSGARRVLRDQRVEVAVLETARGGILRRGLAVRHADAAIVTNVSADHFGEYGVHSLADLADAKLVVARVLDADGVLVLNADDPVLLAKAESLPVALAWFSLDDDHPHLQQHRRLGGRTCGVRSGELVLHIDGAAHSVGDIVDMPLTLSGMARYNIANIAGAALVASVLGVAPERIAEAAGKFGDARTDNPGRLQRWTIDRVEILLDYAHNPDGLAGLLAIAKQLRAERGGRLGLLLGQAGNRDDDALRELARVAANAGPDFVVLKDLDSYLRGRKVGEVPEALRAELLRLGQSRHSMQTVLPEVEAAQTLFEQARAGDVLVLPVHNLSARENIVGWLDSLPQ